MLLFYTDTFVLPLPAGHRFPMDRYRRLRKRLSADHRFRPQQFLVPAAATDEQLLRVHSQDWLHRVVTGALTRDEQRRIGFPWSPDMVERSRRSTGASIQAAHAALKVGCGINLAGGTHHAFADRGAAYCVFNDVAVAVRDVQLHGLVQQVLIVDGDVHQGDGTARIFHDDDNVRTFSLHARKAFPLRKQSSDLDIELPPGTGDDEYLSAWKRGLQQITAGFQPELVFYLAGADPYERDQLGGLSVSQAGLVARDRAILTLCQRNNWPLVIVMAGGYAPEIDDIVNIQFQTIVLAREILSQ
jgi:acetoin utilization deacetylase AcuC-like enzyme